MAEPSINPYAPPESPVESSEPPVHGWSVQGEHLVVRDGTILPPDVDLDGQGAGGPLTPVMLRFLVGSLPRSVFVISWLSATVVVIVARKWLAHPVLAAGIIGFLSVTLVRRLMARTNKGAPAIATVRGHASVKTLRSRARRNRLRSRLSWLGAVMVIGMFGGIGFLSAVNALWFTLTLLVAGVTGLLVILGAVLWQGFDGTWRCTQVQNGWLYLKGVGPAGLAALATRTAETPPKRLRKVFTAYLHRMPLATLARPYPWNPWAWCYLGLLKSLRSKALVAPVFHWSEREWLPPEQGDADLRAEWQRDTAGTPLADWQAVHAERQGGPYGNVQVNELVFLSPDRRHVATTSVVRVANGKIFLEVRDHGFRSWTTDGRTLGTGSEPAEGPMPEEIDLRRVTGSPWQIAQAHLQQTAADDLLVLDPGELRQREETDYERRRQSCEAAGIYGPVEEQEFAG